MAAPLKTARIGLSFDKIDLENSWFLVDFSKHRRIKDVSKEIKREYLNNKYTEQDVILSINNFLFPPYASSELFRENDVVSVRLETKRRDKTPVDECSVPQKCLESCFRSDSSPRQNSFNLSLVEVDNIGHDEDSRKRHKSSKHKRKREKRKIDKEEDLVQIDTDSSQCSERKKKCKGKDEYLETIELATCSSTSVSNNEMINKTGVDIEQNCNNTDEKNSKIKKKSANSDLTKFQLTHVDTEVDSGSKRKEDYGNNTIENNNTTVESFVNDSDSSKCDESSVKSIRKRKRKRKRKMGKRDIVNISDASKGSEMNESSQTYQGRDVERNENGFYGNLPDKLEPPKYYRHGYRNLHSYAVEPNKHIKFGEDSEHIDTEESTKQYNFLCKSRKISDENSTDKKKLSGTESDSQVTNLDSEPVMVQHDSETFQTENDIEDDKQNQPTSENESFTAVPYHYNTSSQDKCPVTLERKQLSNGVSVFVRNRPSQVSLTGFSKQEQLDTKQTNVSTIFVNPSNESEFKVPSSPAPRLSPKIFSSAENRSTKSALKQNGVDFHEKKEVEIERSKPLLGLPEVGDVIAYKVLELSASCTPEVSGYKVAEVLGIDDKQMLELKNLNQPNNEDKQVTKFHVEIEDEGEILTNTADTSDVVTLHFSSLLESRKIMSD